MIKQHFASTVLVFLYLLSGCSATAEESDLIEITESNIQIVDFNTFFDSNSYNRKLRVYYSINCPIVYDFYSTLTVFSTSHYQKATCEIKNYTLQRDDNGKMVAEYILSSIDADFLVVEKIGGYASKSYILDYRVNTVSFYLDGVNYTRPVLSGDLTRPFYPSNDYNQKIDWYIDSSFTQKYDFSWKCFYDISLYGRQPLDKEKTTKIIQESILPANVVIENTSSKTVQSITQKYIKTGSGIIYSFSNNDYYLLTNHHVTSLAEGYSTNSYVVKDYKGNEYSGTLKYTNSSYDLSIISFKKKSISLAQLPIDENKKNVQIGEELIAIGQPNGQANTITFGEALRYNTVNVEGAQVTFKVLTHSCETDHGSSGGAILDSNLELAGIHFAGTKTELDDFKYGHAIPIEKVIEFVKKYSVSA